MSAVPPTAMPMISPRGRACPLAASVLEVGGVEVGAGVESDGSEDVAAGVEGSAGEFGGAGVELDWVDVLVGAEVSVRLLTVPVEVSEIVDLPRSGDVLGGVACAEANGLASVEETEVIRLVVVDVGDRTEDVG